MNERNVAIVTGASSGIGMETAYALARRSYVVALAARRADRLEQVADECRRLGGEATVVPTDVSKREQVEALAASTFERFGRLDVMVNNAGYGIFARVDETTDEQMRTIFDVNFHGLFYGCKAVAPYMMRQRRGHIFNVSSVIGKRGTPMHGAYCATKFAIVGLTDSFRMEMLPYGVRVTCVCPGLTETEFFDRSDRGGRSRPSALNYGAKMPASVVGEKIASVVGKNRPELIFSAGGKLLVKIAAMSPRLADAMMGYYYRKLNRRMETPK